MKRAVAILALIAVSLVAVQGACLGARRNRYSWCFSKFLRDLPGNLVYCDQEKVNKC